MCSNTAGGTYTLNSVRKFLGMPPGPKGLHLALHADTIKEIMFKIEAWSSVLTNPWSFWFSGHVATGGAAFSLHLDTYPALHVDR